MTPFKFNNQLFVLIVILLASYILFNVNCQRAGRNFSFLREDEPIPRSRAAYIDGSLSRSPERLNSNAHTTKRPSRASQSSSSSSSRSSSSSSGSSFSSSASQYNRNSEDELSFAVSDGDESSGRSVLSPKILSERPERPERNEKPQRQERPVESSANRGSSNSETIDSSRESARQDRPITSSSTSSVETSSSRPSRKKGRTTSSPPQVTSQIFSTTEIPFEASSRSSLQGAPPSLYSYAGDDFKQNPPSLASSPSSTFITANPLSSSFVHSNVPSKPSSSSSSSSSQHSFLTHVPCGGNLTVTSLPISIRSPGWAEGNKYPANVECIWTITTSLSHFSSREPSIKVRIKHLEIEQDKVDCPFDYLELRGHKKLCGFIKDKEITINSSNLVIVFRTDSNYEDRGFDLELYSQIDDCVPEIRASSNGELTSPGFPRNYPDSTDCWTLINADAFNNDGSAGPSVDNFNGSQNFTISVTFDFIELEPDDQCGYDFVEFFEVDKVTKKPVKSLGKFCDEKSIKAIPGSGLTGNYSPDVRSVSNSRHHTGSPASQQQVNKPAISAKGPYLLVHFKSDQLLNLKGFKANYKVEAALSRSSVSDCDWLPNETEMTLSSPNHPKPYPPNKDCYLILRAPRSDQKIFLIFETFQMEIDNNCTFDRLEVYDDYAVPHDDHILASSSGSFDSSNRNNNNKPIGQGSVNPSSSHGTDIPMSKEPTKVFCGHKSSKFKFLSGGPVLKLRFVSDSLQEYQGFFARYNFIRSNGPEPTPRPFNAFIESPNNASIIPGSSHLLTCIPAQSMLLSGSKNILWFKDNQLITEGVAENGTKLLIREFSQSDVGRYTCKLGEASIEAWLTVKQSDCRIIFRERPKDMILSEGEFTILKCGAISPTLLASKVTITWTKDGQKVHNTSRVDRLKNGYLVINGVDKNDSGHYFCVVRLEDDPSCTSQAGARLDVNVRANVEDICGKPNLALPSKQKPSLDSNGKIVGGMDSQKGAFPWQVMFWDVNRKAFCGGALLNERWIATAAHCFSQNKYSPPPPPLDSIVVRLGKFDSKENEEQEVNTKIQDIIKHPLYNPETFDNDIAMVRMTDHIIFTDYIKPVCVGFSSQVIEELFFTDNSRSIKMGHVTGWGQLKENGPQPRFLQELRMPIVTQETCKKATSFAVTNNMFCAGYAQEIIGDACKGDSGGPFVSFANDRWYLLGIVSWGEGCGRTGKYGYYTKVSNYVDWIKGLSKH